MPHLPIANAIRAASRLLKGSAVAVGYGLAYGILDSFPVVAQLLAAASGTGPRPYLFVVVRLLASLAALLLWVWLLAAWLLGDLSFPEFLEFMARPPCLGV